MNNAVSNKALRNLFTVLFSVTLTLPAGLHSNLQSRTGAILEQLSLHSGAALCSLFILLQFLQKH